MTRRLRDQDMPATTAVGAPIDAIEFIPTASRAAEVAPSGVAELLAAVQDSVRGPLEQVDVAESMIDVAVHAHPAHADVLWHSFVLLRPTCERMNTDFVYRAHVRELLERVRAGQDTRSGTAAELCAALSEASQRAPLRASAFGLYTRMWRQAFADDARLVHVMPAGEHYEAIAGSQIDDLEFTARAAIGRRVPWRSLTGITCAGRHHGVAVDCRFATTR